MKTISPLNPADLPLAWEIEKLSHSFPWSEETFYSNQGDHPWQPASYWQWPTMS